MKTESGLAENLTEQTVEEEIKGKVFVLSCRFEPTAQHIVTLTDPVCDAISVLGWDGFKGLQQAILRRGMVDIGGQKLCPDQV